MVQDARKLYKNPSASVLFTVAITASETFTAPLSGWYRIYARGPAGSGARVQNAGGAATGGGGGAFGYKRVWLNAGDQVTVDIGAPGAAASAGSNNGNDAGSTIVTGPGSAWQGSLIGGKGGTFTTTGAVALTGALGGVAGGDWDVGYNGGPSGNIPAFVAAAYAATGGGSGGSLRGIGKASGSITGTLITLTANATAGASIAAASASITASGSDQRTLGPGTNGAATINNALGHAVASISGVSTAQTTPNGNPSILEHGMESVINPELRLFGGGSIAVAATTTNVASAISGPGAGTGAATGAVTSGGPTTATGDSGTAGGTGAIAVRNAGGTPGASTVGKPGPGGGSGGLVSAVASTAQPGGSSYVVIECELP